jgi:fumarate hydratase class I
MSEQPFVDGIRLRLPLSDQQTRELKVGQLVLLSGTIVTARDSAHKWMMESFIQPNALPSQADLTVLTKLKHLLDGGAIYHCGPVVERLPEVGYRVLAAGPTTSSREEPYQAEVMQFFNLKAVIGKGGMGARTLAACQQTPAVYLHAVGGAAALIAQSINQVTEVLKLEFGIPEAMWVLEVRDFPAMVSMDSSGSSLHDKVRKESLAELARLFSHPSD